MYNVCVCDLKEFPVISFVVVILDACERKVEIVNANERKGFEVRNFRQEVLFTKNFFLVLTTDGFLFICNFLFFCFLFFFGFVFAEE